MERGTNNIPGTNPGGSTPQSSFSFEDSVISGEDFRKFATAFGEGALDADLASTQYKPWIDSLKTYLSPVAQQVIASWWQFDLLKEVYNCGAAHTKIFGPEVDHTRREHCIHAAYVSRKLLALGQINVEPHERTVLELVMLLHDPHRLGSHALDRVIGSIPGAPPISSWGWGHDFHEYHGAQEVYRDRTVREILGEYWPDVLAVLSFPDTRHPNDPTRIKDFGPTPPLLPRGHRPPLPKERVNLLYRLKDEIDRMSYLELDFRRSGFNSRLVQGLLACIQDYQESMFTTEQGDLAIKLPHQKRESRTHGRHLYAFDHICAARNMQREHIATHPSACFVDALLQEALGRTVQSQFPGRMDTEGCYKFVRNIAIEGSYHKLFGTSVIDLLLAPRSPSATLGIEDLHAPLVTLSRDDLATNHGGTWILDAVAPERSQEICGFPRTDMTRLEYNLRKHLRRQGLDSNIFVILSNDFEKILEFKCVHSPEQREAEKEVSLKGLGEQSDIKLTAELLDVVRFAVRSSPQTEKLIIAMRALDDSGKCRDLKPVQEAVRSFMRSAKLLKDPTSLETKYNHRAFCDPLSPEIFRPDVQERMASFQPEWVTRGGCGLVSPK